MATDRYPVHVFWSAEDQAFVAIAPDLPGSSAIGATQAEALAELETVIDGWIEAQNAVGNPIPPPSSHSKPQECSGRLLLRVPKWLHANLVKGARAEGVSLNSHIMAMLALSVGAKSAGTSASFAVGQNTRSTAAE